MEMEQYYKDNGKSINYKKGRKEWYEKFCENNEWLKDTPPNICYEAMRNASHDYFEFVKKLARGEIASPPRSYKSTHKTFYVLGNCVNPNGIYTRRLGNMFCKERIPEIKRDCRIMHEYNKWYLLVPVDIERQQTENQWRACSIDPGLRTFATVFSMSGIGKIGHYAFNRIVRLATALDRLISLMSTSTARKRYRLKKAAGNIRRKIRNLVDDIHYQTLSFLFRKFDVLILPECNFTSAVRKSIGRKIHRKSVRRLLGWAFARFRDRAINVALKLGKRVLIVNEAYTSKTANWTGEIVHNLGSRKSITSGGLCFDRDINGALGIFLKALMGDPSLALNKVNVEVVNNN